MSSELTLLVHGQPVGELVRDGRETLFNYNLQGLAEHSDLDNAFISLTMPVRKRSYVHFGLHPIFEMHLPEGYLRAVIEKQFAKITEVDDFGLLRLLAPSVVGRLSYGGSQAEVAGLSLAELLRPNSENLFNELVKRFALHSPLSGVQPKVLARVDNKATLRTDEFIVKAWGGDFPQLALNEYFCMRAVQLSGLPVPDFYLSDDDSLFIMKRFDLVDGETPLGFEDFCVLQAKAASQKYQGSYESIAKSIKLFCSAKWQRASLEQLFKMIVLNTYLRNGDAHLKNFGVLYENGEQVRLAPVYDVVSTTAYIENDMAALTLAGSKRWRSKAELIEFGCSACQLTPKRAGMLHQECLGGLQKMGEELAQKLDSTVDADQLHVLEHLMNCIDAVRKSN